MLEERERLMRFELERFTEGFFFLLYDTPDRVQHMLWRFRDREHPGYEPDLARDYSCLIEEHYARCDKLLAPVLDKVDESTLLIVLSDHGFNTFRRAFDTNTWLQQNGLLALKNGAKPSEDLDDGPAAVNWSRTYAYAVGLGGIYLNLKGREREGILEEGTEAERVRDAIQSDIDQSPDSVSLEESEELGGGFLRKTDRIDFQDDSPTSSIGNWWCANDSVFLVSTCPLPLICRRVTPFCSSTRPISRARWQISGSSSLHMTATR